MIVSEEQTETVSSSEEIVGTEEDAPKEDQDEQGTANTSHMMSDWNLSCASNKDATLDSQMDTVIEVKGSTTTVAVTWDQKDEEGEEVDDMEKTTDASDQMMDSGKDVYKNKKLLLHTFFLRKGRLAIPFYIFIINVAGVTLSVSASIQVPARVRVT